MKGLLLVSFLFCTCAFTSAMAQDMNKSNTVIYPRTELLILVRTDTVDYEIGTGKLNTIDSDWVASIGVLKDATAVEAFGDRGKDGVIIIALKEDHEAAAAFLKELKKGRR